MKQIFISSIVVAMVSMLLTACSQRIGDFTIISSKNVDIGGKYTKVDGRFEGSDSRPSILGIPLGTPDLKQAVDNCIEAGKGDLITNAVLHSSWWTAIVYGQNKFTAMGDVWVKASVGDLSKPGVEIYELQSSYDGYRLQSMADPSKSVKVDYFTIR
ncbi:MAG TPA: hypothetical protein VGR15_09020 [Bacteroidota bacterium]|jgi:hypothetical protein|nr:hypothetical protein [Bacteroidota bacterium]